MLDSLNSRDRGRDWLTLWGPHCTRLSCRTGETCDSVGGPPSTRSTPVSSPVDTRYQTPASSSLWKNHTCLQVLKPECSNTTNMQETNLKALCYKNLPKNVKWERNFIFLPTTLSWVKVMFSPYLSLMRERSPHGDLSLLPPEDERWKRWSEWSSPVPEQRL